MMVEAEEEVVACQEWASRNKSNRMQNLSLENMVTPFNLPAPIVASQGIFHLIVLIQTVVSVEMRGLWLSY